MAWTARNKTAVLILVLSLLAAGGSLLAWQQNRATIFSETNYVKVDNQIELDAYLEESIPGLGAAAKAGLVTELHQPMEAIEGVADPRLERIWMNDRFIYVICSYSIDSKSSLPPAEGYSGLGPAIAASQDDPYLDSFIGGSMDGALWGDRLHVVRTFSVENLGDKANVEDPPDQEHTLYLLARETRNPDMPDKKPQKITVKYDENAYSSHKTSLSGVIHASDGRDITLISMDTSLSGYTLRYEISTGSSEQPLGSSLIIRDDRGKDYSPYSDSFSQADHQEGSKRQFEAYFLPRKMNWHKAEVEFSSLRIKTDGKMAFAVDLDAYKKYRHESYQDEAESKPGEEKIGKSIGSYLGHELLLDSMIMNEGQLSIVLRTPVNEQSQQIDSSVLSFENEGWLDPDGAAMVVEGHTGEGKSIKLNSWGSGDEETDHPYLSFDVESSYLNGTKPLRFEIRNLALLIRRTWKLELGSQLS